MQILHIVHQYPPHFVGGTELYTQSLARAQAARGHRVAVLTRIDREGAGHEHTLEEGIAVHRVWWGTRSPAARFIDSFRRPAVATTALGALLDEFTPRASVGPRASIVHVQHLLGLPIDWLRQIRSANLPYVISLHDYWWTCANANLLTNHSHSLCAGPRAHLNCTRCAVARSGAPAAWAAAPALWMLLRRRSRLLRQGLHHASALLAPSRFVRERYRARGIDERVLHLLPLGLAVAERGTSNKHSDTSVDHGQRGLRFVSVGAITPLKGSDLLVNTFRRLCESDKLANAELHLIGDLDVDSAFAAHLQASAPAGVHLHGRLSHEQTRAAVAEADVVLLPARSHETFSFAAREALSAGTPVIASAVGALSELIEDGVNGLLLPHNEPDRWFKTLQMLIAEPQRLVVLAPPSLAFPTVDEHVEKVLAIYRGCLKP